MNGPGAMEAHKQCKEAAYIFTKGNGLVVVDEVFYSVGREVQRISRRMPCTALSEKRMYSDGRPSGGIS